MTALAKKKAAPVKERPILFSAPMVLALLAGRKTQTRREVKWLLEPSTEFRGRIGVRKREESRDTFHIPKADLPGFLASQCPYGRRGDRLWVKETWRAWERESDCLDHIRFRADDATIPIPNTREAGDQVVGKFDCWHPSIFMRRWMSRITLDLLSVRVERLQEISEEDAAAEGALAERQRLEVAGATLSDNIPSARAAFRQLWIDINGVESWESNPRVWVLSFPVFRE